MSINGEVTIREVIEGKLESTVLDMSGALHIVFDIGPSRFCVWEFEGKLVISVNDDLIIHPKSSNMLLLSEKKTPSEEN